MSDNSKPPYSDKKALILSELIKCAQARPFRVLTYAEFGRRVDIPTRGPWKGILDLIAKEERDKKRPDITFLIVQKKTGYPSQINFESANPPSAKQKAAAEAELQRIIAEYSSKGS